MDGQGHRGKADASSPRVDWVRGSSAVHSVTVRQCVILLEDPVSHALPLSLMPCGDRPFLAWVMREMQRFGVNEFIILTAQGSQDIRTAIENLGSVLPRPARTVISVTPPGMGTGGALRHARPHLRGRFLLCPAKTLFSFNLARFLTEARKGHWMLLRPLPSQDQQKEIFLDEERAVSFHKSRETAQPAGVSTGVCLFDAAICETLTETCSLERDVLPELATNGALRGLSLPGDFYDSAHEIGLKKTLKEMSLRLRRAAVFLDRDGVINRDFGWVGTRERFEWEPGAREAVARMTDSGHHVFIVTNQSGIARGFYSENDLVALMDWVIDSIREYGGNVDDWRYCPMHPDAQIERYRGHSPDRKPEPGMILDLLQRWELDPARCVLFGDQPTDMKAARAAGVRGVMVGPERLSDLVPEEEISLRKNGLRESARQGVME